MTIDRSEQLVVVSSATEFGVLRANGKVIVRGKGPFAVDQSRRFGLRWCEGYLMLYQLSPFRRLRTWTEKIEIPSSIQFSRNGRRAISINAQGEQFIWEVDEDNRVYERELLLTPGASYEQLIESFESYLQLFHQARRLMDKKRYFHAYTSLHNARGQSGFLQAQEALQMQWLLCQKLKRGPMEAIWERLFTSGTFSTSLSSNGQALVLAGQREWCVREFGTSSGAVTVNGTSSSPLLHCRHHTSESGESRILLLRIGGRLEFLAPNDGNSVHSQEFEMGILSQASDLPNELFVRSAQNVVAFLQLDTLELSPTFDLKDLQAKQAFPLSKRRILAIANQGPVVVDTIKNKIQAGFPLTLDEPHGDLTFAADYENHSLTALGFSDGTLVIGNTKGGKVLFTHSLDKGAVTSASLNIKRAVGVVVSSTGSMTVFDLRNGQVFERFTAHNEPIESVELCPEARYISTRTRKGQFRFWELSWTLLDQSGAPTIDWLPTGALGKISRMFKFG